MIKFFRKIRQNLLSEYKFSKYLLYAVGEILLVVIGILIALQIDNWNENQKLINNEQQYLKDLKEEFTYNKKELQRVTHLNDNNIVNALELIDNLGSISPEMTENKFGALARGSLSYEIQFNPSQGVLNEIISSGNLSLISNKELKFSLSSWSGLMSEIKLQEEELHRIRYLTIDIIRNGANLRRAIHGPWLDSLGIKQSKFKQGNLPLLNYLPFEGHMMGFVTMSMNINKNEYDKIGIKIEEVLLLINDELEQL
jgi:hypothetical protein